MVTYDIFKTIVTQLNRKNSIKNLGQKRQCCPKIPEIDLDFFRPKNKLCQFDHKISAKSS